MKAKVAKKKETEGVKAVNMPDPAETQDHHAREVFLTRSLGRLIAENALPAVASMLFMAFYQIVDGMMVGRRLGPEAMASVNVLYPIVALLAGLGVMIGVGGNARIAVLLGKGETHRAGRILGLILSLGISLGVTGTLAALLLRPQILGILGTSGQLGIYAGDYLKGLAPFFVFLILTFILEQSLRNDGQPNLASGVMAGCALLNIGLDYVFLFVLNLGIAGAAMASGISQGIGTLVFLGYFLQKKKNRKGGLVPESPEWTLHTLQAVGTNGFSEMFNSLAMGITTFLLNRIIIAHVGSLGVAAFTLVQYLLMLGAMVIIGIGNGAQPIFSYNHGAGSHHRVRGALHRVMAVALGVGGLIFLLMTWQMETVARLFIPDHQEALALTMEVAGVVRWSMLFMPAAMLGSMFFTALEQAGRSMVIAAAHSLVLPVMGLAVFPLIMGASGIWTALVFADGAAALVAVGCLIRAEQGMTVNQPMTRNDVHQKDRGTLTVQEEGTA